VLAAKIQHFLFLSLGILVVSRYSEVNSDDMATPAYARFIHFPSGLMDLRRNMAADKPLLDAVK
jgi:hypothetical protein